jgi:hypothetical protein
VASCLDHKEVIVMRCSSYAALSALCFALVSGLWLAAAAADTPATSAEETESAPAKPQAPEVETESSIDDEIRVLLTGQELLGLDSMVAPLLPLAGKQKQEADADRAFPLYSSRRTWGLNRFAEQSSTEPALFVAEDPQPLFRVPDENSNNKKNTPFWNEERIERLGQKTPAFEDSGDTTWAVNPPPPTNFWIDNWGIHPATPVATPVPASDVLIDTRVVPAAAEELQDGAATETHASELKQGEAAKVILELMDTLGRSVLDGTVFEKPTEVDAQWLKDLDASQTTPREALIQYIRALEAQEEQCHRCTADQAAHRTSDEEVVTFTAGEIEIGAPLEASVEEEDEEEEYADDVDDEQDEIESLRDAGEELDELANRLERRDNYLRADQVRELAAQLRFDARRVRSPEMAEMAEMIPPGASFPVGGPFPVGNMLPPQMPFFPPPTSYPSTLPAYGPMMPHGAPPSLTPTPQPTFESSPNVKQLEAELQVLRAELNKARQRLGARGEAPRR